MSGLTNAKNNFFARMLGKTSKDKSMYPQQEVGISQAPAPGTQPMAPQAMQGNGFMAQMLPNYVGPGAQRNPSQPAVPVGSQPTQTTQPQTQAGQPEQSGTVGAPSSRYRLMEMIEARPERDAEGMATLQKRAKINAIGKGFSALAGLGGMAMGGDAPVITDSVTPWNMNQMQIMDQDYRNRLQDWVSRSFQVEAANNQTLNREVDQQIDAENALERVQLQGENAKELAAQRAEQDLNKLKAQSLVKQMEEMRRVGVDPDSENAYGEYLQKMATKYNADLSYTKARTNWNNRIASGSGRAGSQGQSFDIPTLQKGRQTLLKQYDDQIQSLNQQLKANPFDQAALEQIKQLQAEKKRYFEYNPGSNEMLDAEVMQAAFGTQQQEEQFGTSQTPQNRSAFNFDPNRGFTNVPRTNDPAVQGRIKTSLQRALSNEVTDEEITQLLNDLVMSGEAEDTESAWDILQNYLEENLNNQ